MSVGGHERGAGPASALERNDGEVALAGGRRRRRGLDRAGLGHAAVPLEEHALVHDDHGRLDVPEHTRRAAQLDALGGQHVADDLARDQDDTGADGGVDDALLADDEATVGDDLTAEAAVQHHGTVEGELALDLGALVDEGGEVAGLDLGRAALPSKHPEPPRPVRERRSPLVTAAHDRAKPDLAPAPCGCQRSADYTLGWGRRRATPYEREPER